MNFILLILLFFVFANLIISEPVTIGVISSVVFGVGMYFHKSISCLFNECCVPNTKWLPLNMTKLEEDIDINLHGQHLVKLTLLKFLKSHSLDDTPKRALLLSFNGMPGTGKNFVASMIANSFFKNGMKSKFFHLYLSSVHFPLESKIDEYKTMLNKQIHEAVKLCPRSIFIFDEVQDMPGTLLDVVKPFVDTHESINGVDYRKSIFILLSNSGGKNINGKLVSILAEGRERESLTLQEMEKVLELNLYAMKNDGLRNSKLIKHKLITAFVPFLPLEIVHVRLCIKNQLTEMHVYDKDDLIDQVIALLNFDLHGSTHLSTSGCKGINEKLKLVME